ncbi:unnamed protein product [Adineta ricciae]|uniref:Uncharacterized protein n=1 Tax=Adineta ricciae TaxID=249248 RepID=A0A815T3F8_ADIRI|nr:unnamed protein product [Adineta ricciae]CAF1588827.1 unnamed protein product [Adineta ricciae]
MAKKTTQWRNRRLRLQAIKFGYKLLEKMTTISSTSNNSRAKHNPQPSSPMTAFIDETSLESNTSSEPSKLKRSISLMDIACALVLFKQRHRLSITCMNHLLKLLPYLHHKSMPTSWFTLKKLLQTNTLTSPPIIRFVCPSCSEDSSSSTNCSQCGKGIDPSLSIQSFRNFRISDQLHRIITNNYKYMNLCNKSSGEYMRDICDGETYRTLQHTYGDLFISLTLNIDGIQPNKGSQKTIWPILLIINELPLKRRFSLENIILAGIWPGPKKPSRTHMHLFLKPLIGELIRLEKGDDFFLPSDSLSLSNQLVHIRIYLIAACCDKPAQALIQNIPEPIAAFGCGRCEIPGRMISIGSSKGHVRTFAAELHILNDTKQRCNIRYDTLLALKEMRDSRRALLPERKRKKQAERDKQKDYGILGPCAFRGCSMFDVGCSFMSDSLHNIYIGAFKRMLSLWLSKKYQNDPWSVHSRIKELGELFKGVRLPSTTTRIPRSLIDYSKFKANELRVLLLFGYAIFSDILPGKYYTHLLQLVCLLHLAENRRIPYHNINVMQKLGESFVVDFSQLYTERHCVQVVHSVVHLAATVRDFGPLTSYTTFNFENQLGLLTRTCKSTRRHAQEIISNLQLLQSAHEHLNSLD